MDRQWQIVRMDTFDGPNRLLPCRAVSARLYVAASELTAGQRDGLV